MGRTDKRNVAGAGGEGRGAQVNQRREWTQSSKPRVHREIFNASWMGVFTWGC